MFPPEIHKAAREGNLKKIRDLIEQGVDIQGTDNFMQFTPIEYAVMYNRLSAVKLLIEMGANVKTIRIFGNPDDEIVNFLCFKVDSMIR